MNIREARGLGRERQRGGGRLLRSCTTTFGTLFGRRSCASGVSLLCALWVSTSWAQQPPADAPPAGAEEAPPAAPEAAPPADPAAPAVPEAEAPLEPGLDPALDAAAVGEEPVAEDMPGAPDPAEVVITVDRRRKNLQDYSGTASAFSESQLTNVGIRNVSNLSQVVPGLQIGVNDQGSATVYIRGVGSDNTTELGDPAVAVHIDNVYLPRVRGLNAAYLDIERVEVNSGPQGTLRGRNATGGSINIISKPAVYGQYQANAEVTFGTFRQRAYQGMINIPFGDHVAIRVAGASTTMDSTWTNVGPIDYLPGAQNTDDYALKGQIRMNPTEGLDITIAGDYTLQRSAGFTGINLQNLYTNVNDAGTPDNLDDDFPLAFGRDALGDNPRIVFQRGRYPQTELEHWGVRLNATYDAGPVQFELLGSYRWQDWHLWSGSNAGAFADLDPSNSASLSRVPNQAWDSWSFASQQNNNSGSYVGEFRIASPDTGRVVWSVGLFGFYEDQGAFLGQITGDPDGGFNEFNMPSTVGNSVAGYGDVNFKLTDSFRVLGGVRITKEHKDRLGGLWMIGNGLPQEGLALCANQNAQGQCVQQGLGQGASSAGSNDIGRYGTEGFNYKGLDRGNYNIPDSTASNEDRVNFFLDGIESFGARDQTAIALCNDPPAVQQINAEGNPGNIVAEDSRLMIDPATGNFRCRYGIRDSILDSDTNFTDARPQNGERDDTYFDFRVGFEYDLLADNMLYATLASGHKAGGFNDSIPNPDQADNFLTPDYGPETAYALEIGSKNMLADRKLRINASAFAYMYKGLQFQTILTVGEAPPIDPATGMVAIDPNTNLPYVDNRGGSAARQNAQDTAMIYGLDVDTIYSLPLGFEVDLHALFMDARFPDGTYVNDDRLGLGSAPAQVDIGSNWLPRVSPFTFNYSLSQLIFTDVGSFDWIIQAQTRGKHFFTAFNGDGTSFEDRAPGWGVDPVTGASSPIEADPNLCTEAGRNTCNQYAAIANNIRRLYDEQPTYTTVNVGLGWRKPDGMISVRGFVNNVFNVVYATNIISQAGFNGHYFNDPRMAGVRVRVDF
jgi:iron complex outermembrane recepter protein